MKLSIVKILKYFLPLLLAFFLFACDSSNNSSGNTGNNNSASLVPAWMFIRNSSNIIMVGHEAFGEQDSTRDYIEIFNA